MPAGDAGLERQPFRQRFEALMRELVADSYGGVDAQRYHRVTQGLHRLTREALAEIDRLQAQLAAQQAVVEGFIYCAEQRYWPSAERIEAARRVLTTVTRPSGDTYSAMQAVVNAARWIEEDGWTPVTRGALLSALRSLPAESVQAAQPEGEPR